PYGRGLRLRQSEGAVELRDEVVRILNADGETDEAVADAQARPLLGRDPPMRRDRGVEDLGIEIAQGRGRRDEVERVEEAECGLARVGPQDEGDDAAVPPAELPGRELVLRVRR